MAACRNNEKIGRGRNYALQGSLYNPHTELHDSDLSGLPFIHLFLLFLSCPAKNSKAALSSVPQDFLQFFSSLSGPPSPWGLTSLSGPQEPKDNGDSLKVPKGICDRMGFEHKSSWLQSLDFYTPPRGQKMTECSGLDCSSSPGPRQGLGASLESSWSAVHRRLEPSRRGPSVS